MGNLVELFPDGFEAMPLEKIRFMSHPPETPLDYALAYADIGWHVLPCNWIEGDRCSCGEVNCHSLGKHPLTRHGVTDASADTQTILRWWNRWPKANVAIATGRESGILVIDIDPRNGGIETFQEVFQEPYYESDPATVIANTGGGGRHLIYRYPDDGGVPGNLGKGIDVKKDGGYIIVEPSNHRSGNNYEWQIGFDPLKEAVPGLLPALLLEKLQASSPPPTHMVSTGPLAPETVKDIRVALAFINADDYHRWIQIGMALHSTAAGDQAFDLWDQWSQGSTKYDPKVMPQKWSSFSHDKDKPLNIESIFHFAKEEGYTYPTNPLGEPVSNSGELPTQSKPEPILFPEALFNTPGILGDMTEWINATALRRQPIMALAASICALGTILGRRYQTETGLRTNVYITSLGASGCGKDHPRKAIRKLFQAMPGIKTMIGGGKLASGAALIQRVALQPSVLFMLDEIGKKIITWNNPRAPQHLAEIIPIFLELFSSANSIYGGSEQIGNGKTTERTDIDQPNVSVYGTTTKEDFFAAFTSGSVDDGFLNRWLVVESLEDRPPKQDSQSITIPSAIIKGIETLLATKDEESGNLVGATTNGTTAASVRTITMTQSGRKAFDDFDLLIDAEVAKTRSNGLDRIWVRAWEHAAKLALIHACSRQPSTPVIDHMDAVWSISFVTYSTMLLVNRVASHVGDNQHDQQLKRMLRFVGNAKHYQADKRSGHHLKNGYMPKGKLLKLMKLSKWELDQLIDTATEAEMLAIVKQRPSTVGKQPVLYYLPAG